MRSATYDADIEKMYGTADADLTFTETAGKIKLTNSGYGYSYYPTGLDSLARLVQGLFSKGEQGVYFDPSDISTLYQDAAGTTPVTAMEQPVGLMLDKSKGLVLGPELVTGFAKTGDNGINTVTLYNDGFDINQIDESSVAAASIFGTFTAGKIYKITADVVVTAGSFKIQNVDWGTVAYRINSNVLLIRCTKSTNSIGVYRNALGNNAISMRNISVRELSGNHCTFKPSTGRPVLSARYNLLTYTEQFDNAVWPKTASTVAATVAPDGSSTAWAIKDTSSTADHFVTSYVGTQPTQSWTFNLWLKAGSQRYARVHLYNATAGVVCDTFFDLQNDGQVVSGGAGVTWTITPGDNGWIQFSGVTTAITGGASHGIYIYAANTAPKSVYLGDGSAAIYVWHPDLRPTNDGVGIPAYQRVVDSATYDTAGFPVYLRTDGTDDGGSTNSIDFTGTDKVTVFAGVRKLSDAIGTCFYELSSSIDTNTGTFDAIIPSAGQRPNYLLRSKGTEQSNATTPNEYAAPHTSVLTHIASIGDDINKVRVNGTQVAAVTTDQGTGNFGHYPLYLFARNNASFYFNGRLYGLIVIGRAATSTEIANTERYLNMKAKVY